MNEVDLTEIEKKIISVQAKFDKQEENKLDEDTCSAWTLNQDTIKRIVIHHTAVEWETEIVYKAISNSHKQRRIKWMKVYEWMPSDTMERVETVDWNFMMYHRLIWKDWKIVWTRSENQVGRGSKYNCNNIWTFHIALIWNFNIKENKPSDSQYNALNRIIAELRTKYWNIPIYWHWTLDNEATACPWKNFDYTRIEGWLWNKEPIAKIVDKQFIPEPVKTIWEDLYLWIFEITRYYTCDIEQTKRLPREVNELKKTLTWWREPTQLQLYNYCYTRQFWTDTDIYQPKYWPRYTNTDAWFAVACPPEIKWRSKLKIEWYDKIVTCRDVWRAIKNKRLDLYAWIWDFAIETMNQYPSWKRRIYIVK